MNETEKDLGEYVKKYIEDFFYRLRLELLGQREGKGAISRTREHGIEIHNRTWREVALRLFWDDPVGLKKHVLLRRRNKTLPGNREIVYFNVNEKKDCRINQKGSFLGLDKIFQDGNVVVDLGCGGGDAAKGMAAHHGKVVVIGGDVEMGREIHAPEHKLMNLKFFRLDWNCLGLSANSVDAWISDQGIARYGGGHDSKAVEELTRVSKIGAILRATQANRIVIGQKSFAELLVDHGWEVYILVVQHDELSRRYTNVICAKLVSKLK